MRLDQDEETIYADYNADIYNDLIEYQFNKIVELMSGSRTGESIQEKVAKGAVNEPGYTHGCGV